jgi:hypothetical protein
VPNSIYRIYVDNDLMTERTVRWDTSTHYVRENVIIQVPKNTQQQQHTIRLEATNQCDFLLSNIVVDGKNANDTFIV